MKKLWILFLFFTACTKNEEYKIEINNQITQISGVEDFGSVLISATPQLKSLTFMNIGTSPMSVPVNAPTSQEFSVIYSSCRSLQPLQTCFVKILFTPRSLGEKTYNINIANLTIPVKARVIEPVAEVPAYIITSDSSFDFGTLTGSQSLIKEFTITNMGYVGMTFENATLEGSDFQVYQNSCINIKLYPNRSCTIRVRFTAVNKNDGDYLGKIRFADQEEDITARVEGGFVVAPRIVFLDGTTEVSSVYYTAVSGNLIMNVSIRNSGNSVTPVITTSLSNPIFSFLSDTCVNRQLAIGTSCLIRVLFSVGSRPDGLYQTNLAVSTSVLPINVTIQRTPPPTCSSGEHLEGNICVNNIQSCLPHELPPNAASGQKGWTGSGYSACTVSTCNSGFARYLNECVPSQRECQNLPSNALAGYQTWIGVEYSSCIISTCYPGYNLDSGNNVCVDNRCQDGVSENRHKKEIEADPETFIVELDGDLSNIRIPIRRTSGNQKVRLNIYRDSFGNKGAYLGSNYNRVNPDQNFRDYSFNFNLNLSPGRYHVEFDFAANHKIKKNENGVVYTAYSIFPGVCGINSKGIYFENDEGVSRIYRKILDENLMVDEGKSVFELNNQIFYLSGETNILVRSDGFKVRPVLNSGNLIENVKKIKKLNNKLIILKDEGIYEYSQAQGFLSLVEMGGIVDYYFHNDVIFFNIINSTYPNSALFKRESGTISLVGSQYGDSQQGISCGGRFYFRATISGNNYLMMYNNSDISQLNFVIPNGEGNITCSNNTLYLGGTNLDNNLGVELYYYTPGSGFKLIKDERLGLPSTSPKYMTRYNDFIYYINKNGAYSELFRTDGQENSSLTGPSILGSIFEAHEKPMSIIDNKIYFSCAKNGNHICESEGLSTNTREYVSNVNLKGPVVKVSGDAHYGSCQEALDYNMVSISGKRGSGYYMVGDKVLFCHMEGENGWLLVMDEDINSLDYVSKIANVSNMTFYQVDTNGISWGMNNGQNSVLRLNQYYSQMLITYSGQYNNPVNSTGALYIAADIGPGILGSNREGDVLRFLDLWTNPDYHQALYINEVEQIEFLAPVGGLVGDQIERESLLFGPLKDVSMGGQLNSSYSRRYIHRMLVK